jgi:beta-galactosidase/beta-glucuronidase
MPKKIPIRAAAVGQILAESVVQGQGQVLLSEGTALDSSNLDLLRQRGVVLVTIEDGEEESSAPDEERTVSDAELKKILLEESQWFGESRKDDFLAEVFRWVVGHRARTGGEGL